MLYTFYSYYDLSSLLLSTLKPDSEFRTKINNLETKLRFNIFFFLMYDITDSLQTLPLNRSVPVDYKMNRKYKKYAKFSATQKNLK